METYDIAPAIVRHVDDLAELAQRINKEHEAGEDSTRRGLEHYRAAGEILLRAKQRCGHGKWLSWLKANVKFNERRAQRYMELAKSDVTSDLEEQEDAWQRISGNLSPVTPAEEKQFSQDNEREVNWVDKQCASIEWYTPPVILDRVRTYFDGPIPLDPATAATNPTQALRFFTQDDDGLEQDWRGSGVFVNPPYGKVLPDWTAKIHDEAANGVSVLALLPCGARFSTGYWQENILSPRLDAICFLRGRVAFLDPGGEAHAGNTYDSAIYGFNVQGKQFVHAFRPLGKTLLVKEAHE